jgi:sugar phosphate isomerase/epimerase
MIKLSGFADEISLDLQAQLDTLESLDLKYLEFRGVWGKNVLDLTDDELGKVKQALRQRGIGVSAIGSPIGKAPIDVDFAEYKERVQRAIDVANEMQAPYIRMFSFYIDDLDSDRDRVMEYMQTMIDMAAAGGVVMLHENEKDIYGELPERCLDLHETVTGDSFGAVFDPANFVQAGVEPFDRAYPLLKPYIKYYHIKDAIMDSGKVVPAGQGDGQIKKLMAAAKKVGYEGFLSLEPHLKVAGHSSGFTGPELFGKAHNALCAILDDLDIAYE